MSRLAPIFVSFLGSLGLGLAFGYVVLVVRAFQPGAPELVRFLVGGSDDKLGVGFLIVLVPYALLMLHLWLRIRLGSWLVDRGELDLAEAFASRRLRAGLLRARKEALAHRTTLVRIALRREDYARARELCEGVQKLPRGGHELVEFRRWELETALRTEDLVAAHAVVEKLGVPKERSSAAAAFCAAAAEIFVREGDRAAADEWMQRAEFAERDDVRLRVTRHLARARFGEASDDVDTDDELDRFFDDFPGATGEVIAAHARIATLQGDGARGRDLLAEARACPADARSEFVIDSVARELDPAADQEE